MALNSASKVIDWFLFKEKGKPAFLKEFKSVLFTLHKKTITTKF